MTLAEVPPRLGGVTDAANHTFDKNFTIAVTDVNEAPTNISLSNASVAEKGN